MKCLRLSIDTRNISNPSTYHGIQNFERKSEPIKKLTNNYNHKDVSYSALEKLKYIYTSKFLNEFFFMGYKKIGKHNSNPLTT